MHTDVMNKLHTYLLCVPVCTHDSKWRPHKLPAMASFSCVCQLSAIVVEPSSSSRDCGRAAAQQVHKKAAAKPKINCQIF